jgi:hypothetical protein
MHRLPDRTPAARGGGSGVHEVLADQATGYRRHEEVFVGELK